MVPKSPTSFAIPNPAKIASRIIKSNANAGGRDRHGNPCGAVQNGKLHVPFKGASMHYSAFLGVGIFWRNTALEMVTQRSFLSEWVVASTV